MKMFATIPMFSLILAVASPLPSAGPATINTISDLSEAIREDRTLPLWYDIVADVTYVSTNIADKKTNVVLTDATGSTRCRAEDRNGFKEFPRCGARARCQGFVEKSVYGRTFPVLTSYEEISFGTPRPPVKLTRAELFDGRHDFTLCEFEGTLRDVVQNETDPYWLYLTIYNGEGRVFATVPISDAGDLVRMEKRIGGKIVVTGICVPYDHSLRIQIGRVFKIAAIDQIRFPKEDEDSASPPPMIKSIRLSQPSDIATLGHHRAIGWVVAVWRGNHALVRTEDDNVIWLEFAASVQPPSYGQKIEATGLPDTDLFRINLFNATWRLAGPERLADDPPNSVSAKSLTRDERGKKRVNCDHYGHAISIAGVVRSLSKDLDENKIYVESDGCLVPVDASATPSAFESVSVGSTVRVAGTCVLEVDTPRLNSAIPRLLGFGIIVRTPDDVTVLSHPSWWTPARLLTLVGTLLVALLAILAWNASLRKLAEKRGKELASEKIAHVTSELKVYERTRLAVELHDSIAQNLTGVSLEIDTAERLADANPRKMREHLNIASTSLKSCRSELRNCLWDLRHQTLETDDMESAIRRTLEPHVAHVNLAVRFKVPRDRISDNTAHAILRIIRELTVNAVRHGKATAVKVAGSIEGHKLKFSVRDNGCGFDPNNRPGEEQGHYGLLGIRERINSFEGRLTLESSPGAGTKATIYLNIPQEQQA